MEQVLEAQAIMCRLKLSSYRRSGALAHTIKAK